MKIKDFFFNEVLDNLEVGHVLGGTTCVTGGTTTTCASARDEDGENGDSDIDDSIIGEEEIAQP